MRPVPALLVGLLLFLAALGPAGAGGAAGAGGFLVVAPSPGQKLAIFDRPGGTVVARGGRSEFGGPVVAGVVAREGPWVGVTTELLPNRRVGWVDTRNGVVVSRVEEALRVHLSARRLDIFRAGTLAVASQLRWERPPRRRRPAAMRSRRSCPAHASALRSAVASSA